MTQASKTTKPRKNSAFKHLMSIQGADVLLLHRSFCWRDFDGAFTQRINRA